MPPELAAVRIPGIGAELMRKLGVASRTWPSGSRIVRAEAEGTVRPAWGGRDRVTLHAHGERHARACARRIVIARAHDVRGRRARGVAGHLRRCRRSSRRIDEVKLIEEAPLDSAGLQLHRDAPLRRRAHGPRPADERRRARLPGARGARALRRRLERVPDEPRREPAALDHGAGPAGGDADRRTRLTGRGGVEVSSRGGRGRNRLA